MPRIPAPIYNILSSSATHFLPENRENANALAFFFWGQMERTMVNTRSDKWEGHIWWVLLLALLGLVALFTACGGGRQPGAGPPATGVPAAPPDSMHLTDSVFQAHRAAFDRAFSLTDGSPLVGTQQELPWSDLAAWMMPTAGDQAVRFEYGLRDSAFVLGLVRLQLDTTPTAGHFTYLLPDSVYELAGGTLVPHDGTTWRADRQYKERQRTTYFGGVLRADRTGALQPLTHGADAQANVMPWQLELEPLHHANRGPYTDSTLFAVFTCIARPDSAQVLQHHMAVHLRLRPNKGTGYRDLLDNSYTPGDPFRMHGADVGALCPPTCATYQLVPQ